jgi:hypothetical protein
VAASRRGCTRETETEGGGVKVDDDRLEEEDVDGVLRVGDETAACSKAEVKAETCSKAGDEAAACCGARIEDGRWWQHDGV